MRFGLITNTNAPFLEYNFYNASETDTTISETKDKLKTWTIGGFDETFFSDLLSDGAGGIFNLGLGDFEEDRSSSVNTLNFSDVSNQYSSRANDYWFFRGRNSTLCWQNTNAK